MKKVEIRAVTPTGLVRFCSFEGVFKPGQKEWAGRAAILSRQAQWVPGGAGIQGTHHQVETGVGQPGAFWVSPKIFATRCWSEVMCALFCV